MDNLHTTDSRELRKLANELKVDLKLYQAAGVLGGEKMRLFQLYKRILTELHRRTNPAISYQWN